MTYCTAWSLVRSLHHRLFGQPLKGRLLAVTKVTYTVILHFFFLWCMHKMVMKERPPWWRREDYHYDFSAMCAITAFSTPQIGNALRKHRYGHNTNTCTRNADSRGNFWKTKVSLARISAVEWNSLNLVSALIPRQCAIISGLRLDESQNRRLCLVSFLKDTSRSLLKKTCFWSHNSTTAKVNTEFNTERDHAKTVDCVKMDRGLRKYNVVNRVAVVT